MAAGLGLDLELLEEVSIASGFEPVDPDLPVYADEDLAAFAVLRDGMAFFSWPELVSFTRVMGSSMGRIADAATSLFVADVARPMVEAGATDLDVEERSEQATALAGRLSLILGMMLRMHISLSTERDRMARGDQPFGSTLSLAVGFIDLVGFTPHTLALAVDELAELVADFEAQAHDTVTVHGGRLVKLIGDEVMYVAVDPTAACRIAEALLTTFGSAPTLTPRGGLAFGPVLARGGDYFGPTVNLAARLADQAVPGEVLVNDAVAEAAHRPVGVAGRRMLKGFSDPVAVWSLGVE